MCDATDTWCSDECSRKNDYSCSKEQNMRKEKFLDYVERYMDFEEVRQWAEDNTEVWS